MYASFSRGNLDGKRHVSAEVSFRPSPNANPARIIRLMLSILALNLIPTALITLAWVSYLRRRMILPRIRRILFVCGLVIGSIASILLIVFLLLSFLDPSSIRHVNQTAGYIWMAASFVALISTMLALTGRSTARVFATACGLLLVVLLYISGLATSI
jgi:hypothetical protein